jgi:hypothetical protein
MHGCRERQLVQKSLSDGLLDTEEPAFGTAEDSNLRSLSRPLEEIHSIAHGGYLLKLVERKSELAG